MLGDAPLLTETNPIVPRSHTLFFLCSPSAAVSFFAPAAPFPTIQGHFLPFFTTVVPARPATLRQLPSATAAFIKLLYPIVATSIKIMSMKNSKNKYLLCNTNTKRQRCVDPGSWAWRCPTQSACSPLCLWPEPGASSAALLSSVRLYASPQQPWERETDKYQRWKWIKIKTRIKKTKCANIIGIKAVIQTHQNKQKKLH